MPRRSELDKLPVETRAKIDALIAANAFGNYQQLADQLAEQGIALSCYQLKTHGAKLSTEIAQARREALLLAAVAQGGDESASLFEAVADIGLLRSAQALTAIDGTEDPAALNKILSGAAAIGRVSIEAKKWNLISRAEIERKLKQVEQELKDGDQVKTPEEMIALIRTQVFGFAQLQSEEKTIDI